MGTTTNDFGLLSPIYKQMSASALVKTGYGRLRGIFCSSSTGGTLALSDSLATGAPLIANTFDLTGATYYNMADVAFGTGLYVTITNAAEITVFYF
jgi:hypothetical protein